MAGAAVVGALLAWLALAPWARANLRAPGWPPAARLWLTVTVAAGFALTALVVGLRWELPPLLLFVAGGAAMSAVDLLERRIPNRMLVVTAPAVGAAVVLAAIWRGSIGALLWSAAGAAGLFVVYLIVALLAPSAMGMGDVKLAALAGAVLGFVGPTAILLGAVAISVVGGVAAGALILARRGRAREGVPYGPALVLGGLMGALLAVATR